METQFGSFNVDVWKTTDQTRYYCCLEAGSLFNGVALSMSCSQNRTKVTAALSDRQRHMMKPEPESAETELRSGKLLEVMEAVRGEIFFVKTLAATNAYRKENTCNGLTLPPWFVKDYSENLHKSVVLLTDKAWELRFAIARSREPPVVLFCGGWKDFAMSNNLAEGDHLLFKLSAMSQFDVYIFNADGTPKTMALPTEAPVYVKPEASELPEVEEMKFAERRQEGPLPAEERNLDSANGFCGFLAKEEIRELPGVEEKDANEDEQENQKSHPSFDKRLVVSNFNGGSARGYGVPYLEIPAAFARTHGSRLRTIVTLQGIYEESPVCTVACSWGQDTRSKALRLFFRYGWKEFLDENFLEVEQGLEFTLVSDSFFVVREII